MSNFFILTNIFANQNAPAIPGKDEIFSLLIPNIYVLVSHLIATIILLTTIICLVWKPTKKYLAKRKEQILEDVNKAEEQKLLAAKNLEKSNQQLMDSKMQALQQFNEEMAKIEEKKIIAYQEIEDDKVKYNLQKEQDKQKMINDFDKKVSELAIDVAEVFLSEKIDKNKNQKIIDSILKDLKKEKKL